MRICNGRLKRLLCRRTQGILQNDANVWPYRRTSISSEAAEDNKEIAPEEAQSEPDIRTGAAPILRTLIDEIVLHPGDKRGKMSIEVYGEPSALFLLAGNAPAAADNWMITVVAEERCRLSPHLQNVRDRLRSSA